MAVKSGSVSEIDKKRELAFMVQSRQNCIEYIMRCCFAYLTERMNRIKHLRWKHGGHLPADTKVIIPTLEFDYIHGYKIYKVNQNGVFYLSQPFKE